MPKMDYFVSKSSNLQALGALPPNPLASGDWAYSHWTLLVNAADAWQFWVKIKLIFYIFLPPSPPSDVRLPFW